MMIRLVSATTRKSLSIDGISSSQNAFATRCFSVRELPWCAPSDSPVRRSKGETEKKGKTEQTDQPAKPIERFGIVAAMSTNRVIGMDGGIPWRLPADRKLFKSLTKQGILIIGKRTFDEHPNLAHVNHTKYCIVVSNSTKSLNDDKNNAPNTVLKLVKSLPEALSLAKELDESLEEKIDEDCDLQCWVAGGERMYLEALQHPSAAEIHLSVVDTEISRTQGKDLARFPSKYRWDHKFEEASERAYAGTETFPSFTYFVYKRIKRRL